MLRVGGGGWVASVAWLASRDARYSITSMNTGYAPFRYLPKEAANIAAFKQCKKRYVSPPDYLPWSQYVAALALEIAEDQPTVSSATSFTDWARLCWWSAARHYMRLHAPAYFAGADLIKALKQTPATVPIEDFPAALPCFSVHFPRGSMIYEHEGEVYNCWAALYTDLRLADGCDKTSGKHLASAWILAERADGLVRCLLPCPIHNNDGQVSPLWPNEEFSRVALGCYLGLLHQQFEITDEIAPAAPGVGFGKPRGPQPLPCRWIGKHFKIRREPSPARGGTHASPQAHWRRGHWHRVRHGQGKEQSKLLWYQPVFVNG